MKSNKLVIFTLITLAVILAAGLMSRHRAPATSLEKQSLFAGLLEKVNNVTTIKLMKQNKSLTLVRHEDLWVIQQADNYPADFGKIREVVIAVADLKILVEKTSNSALYERLGVEEPSSEKASSTQLSLLDADDKVLAELIVGKNRHSKSAEDKPGLYVRLPESQTALLVEGRLDPSVEVKDWFNRELFSIKASRIKQIQIEHTNDATFTLAREDNVDDFSMNDLPEGMEMQSDVIISRMATLLEDVAIDNVVKAEKLTQAKQSTATIHTFDGLVVTVVNGVIDDNNYSSFSFSVAKKASDAAENESDEKDEESNPAEEAETLNKLMTAWAYAIPTFKYELFTRKQAQLIKEITPTDEAADA
ncbi:MAG: hypothetical protein ACI9SC_002914, partial [Gammaproteobacteria bacterium]